MNIKQKIRSFNFAEAEFEKVPTEIFQIHPNSLSDTDRAILDSIKFQKTVSKYNETYQYINQSIGNLPFLGQLEIRSIRNFVIVPMALFLLLSLTYYANVNLNLGMDFLTEMFA